MYQHIIDLSLFWVIYLILFLAFYGWGRLLASSLKLQIDTDVSTICRTIWIGWLGVICLLQIIHFWFAIDIVVSLFIYGIGTILALPSFITYIKKQIQAQIPRSYIIYGVFIFCFICWIASHSMLVPKNYDSGLYHFNVIRWNNSYPVIPGLGNLHSRFAFNQSFFLYVASLNFFPYINYGRSFANSFLFLLLCWEVAWKMLKFLQVWKSWKSSESFLCLPYLFVIPLLFYLSSENNGMASPAPDLTATLIQIYMFFLFVQIVCGAREQKYLPDNIIALIFVAAISITIKLSNLAYAMTIMSICALLFFHFRHKTEFFARKTIISCVLIAAIFIPWIARSYILSGYPLYPSTIGKISTEWTMPIEDVQDTANWIYSWARQSDVHWSKVLGNWNWLYPWVQLRFKDMKQVFYPCLHST